MKFVIFTIFSISIVAIFTFFLTFFFSFDFVFFPHKGRYLIILTSSVSQLISRLCIMNIE